MCRKKLVNPWFVRSFRSSLEESRKSWLTAWEQRDRFSGCGIQLLFHFFCISICCSVYHINIAPNHFHIKTWKPMRATGSQIYFDKWPSHRLGSFTFFRSISDCTESDIRATKPLFDPWKALKLPYFPGAVNYGAM